MQGDWKADVGRRLRTDVTQTPQLARDCAVWNKLFRRAFFDSAGLAFPEGVHHEDLAMWPRVPCLATSIDVLPEVVYYWRIRDRGELSITQQSMLPRSLVDHVAAMESGRNWLRYRTEPHARACLDAFDQYILTDRIPFLFPWVYLGVEPTALSTGSMFPAYWLPSVRKRCPSSEPSRVLATALPTSSAASVPTARTLISDLGRPPHVPGRENGWRVRSVAWSPPSSPYEVGFDPSD